MHILLFTSLQINKIQLRSGTRKGGEEPQRTPSDTPSEVIPGQIEVTAPEQGFTTPVRTVPTQAPEVYVAGTYAASLPRSPSEPANFKPAQLSLISQPDHRTAREPGEEGELVVYKATYLLTIVAWMKLLTL